jgi:glycine betaine/proline transport system permease protein
MQTMPPFVYLIPAVLFFGLGSTPGIVATVIFAIVPGIRLTSLGMRQIQPDLIEAGRAFGCNTLQLLRKVEIPNAMPSIMMGINQVIMMSLSMVIITALIGAGGLGAKIVWGIQRMYVGMGMIAGLAVVLVAILLDRVTQNIRKGWSPDRKSTS